MELILSFLQNAICNLDIPRDVPHIRICVFVKIKENDILAICDVGAYGSVLSSNYNLRTKSPEVIIDKSKTKLVKKRQNIIDII